MNEAWGRDTELEKWMTVMCVGGWGDGEFRLSHREIFLMLPGLLRPFRDSLTAAKQREWTEGRHTYCPLRTTAL